MPALVMTFLWSLLLQSGMLLGVRVFYKRWSPLKQRLVASFTLPVAVALMAVWMRFDPSLCSAANPDGCPQAYGSVMFALMMIGTLLLSAFLLSFIGTLRRR